MKNNDSFTPNFWDDGLFKPHIAKDALKKHTNWIRIAYQFTYEDEHDYDEKLHQNFLRRLDAARTAALLNLPNHEHEIDQWIEDSLSTVVRHLGYANAAACRGSDYIKTARNPYIKRRPALASRNSSSPSSLSISSYPYKGKSGQVCTLFDDELDNCSITEDDKYAALPTTIWGTKSLSDYERVIEIFKRRLAARGLNYWTIEDAIDQANEDYVQMRKSNPDQKPQWYAKRLEWKSNDRYDTTQTNKYRTSNEREVDLILTEEAFFPVETNTVEYLVTLEDYYDSLNKTQRKTFRDLQEYAQKGEKLPRTLKARAARLPDTNHRCITVERVERFNEPAKPQDARGLREYATENELMQKYPEYLYPVVVRSEKPASPTIKYYAKNNKQHA